MGDNMSKIAYFTAAINKNGLIFEYDPVRRARGEAVGYDNQHVEEIEANYGEAIAELEDAKDTCERLYQELVEAGLREVKKTAEQIVIEAVEEQKRLSEGYAESQNLAIETQNKAIDQMGAELHELKAMISQLFTKDEQPESDGDNHDD